MILISNNLRDRLEFPEGAVVRVNSAWVRSKKELEGIISDNRDKDIFLDYPSGRTKPPKPVLHLDDLLDVTYNNNNIKYFAISNAEVGSYLKHIYEALPHYTELVPKIETLHGIKNIEQVLRQSHCSNVMLDKEDLYLSCGTDTKLYEKSIGVLKEKCHEYGVNVLELRGVFFG